MAQLNIGAAVALTATGVHPMGDAGASSAAGFLVAVRSQSSLAGTFRAEPRGTAVTASSPQLAYLDLADADHSIVAGTTDVAANGNYYVRAPGLAVAFHTTAGTATVTVVPLED
jgi:hypothetical protein